MDNAPLAPLPGSMPDTLPALNVSGIPSHNMQQMPRHAIQAMDPAFQPYGHRQYVPHEVGGASYGVSVGFEAHVAPEAGFTQANGKISRPAVNRTAPNFYTGAADRN
jgi:hypothetical protein